MLTKIAIGLAVFGVAIAGTGAPSDSMDLARRHSCGYKCNLDGSNTTPSEPKNEEDTTYQAGRTNVHSGGHGEKRHGGGGQNNPHSNEIITDTSENIQMVVDRWY